MGELLRGWDRRIESATSQNSPRIVAETLSELGYKVAEEGAVLPKAEAVKISGKLIAQGYLSDSLSLGDFLSSKQNYSLEQERTRVFAEATSSLPNGDSVESLTRALAISDFAADAGFERPAQLPSEELLLAKAVEKVSSISKEERSGQDLSIGLRGALRTGDVISAEIFTEQLLEAESVDPAVFAMVVRDVENEWSKDKSNLEAASALTSLYLRRNTQPEFLIAETTPGHLNLEPSLLHEYSLSIDAFRRYADMNDNFRIAIERKNETALGTGILIKGPMLGLSDPAWFSLTNAHVVSEDPAELEGDPPASKPRNAIAFPKWQQLEGLEFDSVHRTSSRTELDFSLISMGGLSHDHSAKLEGNYPKIAEFLPVPGTFLVGLFSSSRSIVPQVKLGNFLEANEGRMHYTLETFPGHSGGPIMNNVGEVLGIHSAKPSGQEYARGIFIQSIVSSL
ncbi:MAG: serine protease [Verrucomicrobiota bacterium]